MGFTHGVFIICCAGSENPAWMNANAKGHSQVNLEGNEHYAAYLTEMQSIYAA